MTNYKFKCLVCGALFTSLDAKIHEMHAKQCPSMKIVSVKKESEQ